MDETEKDNSARFPSVSICKSDKFQLEGFEDISNIFESFKQNAREVDLVFSADKYLKLSLTQPFELSKNFNTSYDEVFEFSAYPNIKFWTTDNSGYFYNFEICLTLHVPNFDMPKSGHVEVIYFLYYYVCILN